MGRAPDPIHSGTSARTLSRRFRSDLRSRRQSRCRRPPQRKARSPPSAACSQIRQHARRGRAGRDQVGGLTVDDGIAQNQLRDRQVEQIHRRYSDDSNSMYGRNLLTRVVEDSSPGARDTTSLKHHLREAEENKRWSPAPVIG